ncbi:MAG: GTPase domain-containing protein, partial [Acetobacteraceae bacterium]|nr:GTPase domain-containing protein [Acetobacteraceae bacterium]
MTGAGPRPAGWRSALGRVREEALILLLLALPWLVLLPFGAIWLWQHGLVFAWVVFAALLAFGVFLLRMKLRREAAAAGRALAAEAAPPGSAWGPKEREAWRRVERLAEETEPFLLSAEPEARERILRRLTEVLAEVARVYHDGTERPELAFTPAEGLRAVEVIARRLRQELLGKIPLHDQVSVRFLVATAGRVRRNSGVLLRLWRTLETAWRGARAALNPGQAVVQEAGRALIGQVTGQLTEKARAFLTAALIREVGREAIELYSGRRRDLPEEALPPADTVGPVRVLLCGQGNAGKSALFNALAGQVERQATILPQPQAPGETLLCREGRPEIVLREMGGLSGREKDIAALLQEAEQADAILWVVSAVQPARAADMQALSALRARMAEAPERAWPPLLGVVTHVDLLSPKAEWAPPYDLNDNARPKAKAMREALEAIAADLPIALWIPVACPEGAEPYNLEAVWAVIGHALDAARAAKIER